MLAPLMLMLVLPGADPNEGEKLFRQMETKLMKAKTAECIYEAKLDMFGKGGALKGTMLVGDGSKSRIEMTVSFDNKDEKMTMLCDGSKMRSEGPRGPSKADDVPKGFGEMMRATLARSGVGVPMIFIARVGEDKNKEFKVDEEFRVADFKLGKKEMVGKQEAQIVEHTLMLKGDQKPIAVSVWIDTKTQLPLKRVLTATMGDMKMTITENYTKLELDGKIDPKQFELPKE
jgi:hypothetical protein